MANSQFHDYLFKVVIIGDSGAGKTNMLSRFTKDEFSLESRTTIGVDFATHYTKIQEKVVRAHIWDTAGQEQYRVLTTAFYRGAVGALLVYDITRRGSFTSIVQWLYELREFANPNAVCLLIGNKSDLGHIRAVSTEEGAAFAAANGMSFLETSALDTSNVAAAFNSVIQDVFEVIVANPTLETAVSSHMPSKGIALNTDHVLRGPGRNCSC
ncbi:ras-domain-containing protein [Auriculariales sp. MPI-PUGE-AT-0066]|nr:ras-domain-containing protein [Auriculariales sp. MPI-PUGE-AT-0066]